MSHIFISYVHADSGFTEDLVRDLEQHGVRCWIDHARIGVAQVWRNEIAQAIKNCTAFLVVLSPRSVESAEVKRELAYAASRGRRIVPVVYQAVELPPEIELAVSDVQWVDFDQLTYEDAFDRLAQALVPTEPKPPAVPRPKLVLWIAAGYILIGVNFLSSFGVCLVDVAFKLSGPAACLEGLGLALFDLVVIDAFLLLTVATGFVLLLRRDGAAPVFVMHWVFHVLLAAWTLSRTRYGVGVLIGLLVSTPAAWYACVLGRLQKSGRRPADGRRPIDGRRSFPTI